MKTVRIISIIVLAGMLAATLALAFPGRAHAQGTNPPAGQEPPASQAERLEKAYQRELKAADVQLKRLTAADERIEKLAGRIADLKSQGKDTTALEKALAGFKEALKEANTTHEKAAGILKAHAGFDDQGKVSEIQPARETVKEAEILLRAAHRDLRPALRKLVRIVGEYWYDNLAN